MANLRDTFGRLVAAHRKRRRLTQAELAEAADISVDMLSKVEVGASGARFPVIERLAGALEIDPAELFTTEIPGGAIKRGAFAEISSRLAQLPEADLVWVRNLLDAALAQRGADQSTLKATASTTRKTGTRSQVSRMSKAKSR